MHVWLEYSIVISLWNVRCSDVPSFHSIIKIFESTDLSLVRERGVYKSITMGATSEAGTVRNTWVSSPLGFNGVRARSLIFCVVFCRSLLVFFFGSLYFLSFCNLQLLTILLVSSNLYWHEKLIYALFVGRFVYFKSYHTISGSHLWMIFVYLDAEKPSYIYHNPISRDTKYIWINRFSWIQTLCHNAFFKPKFVMFCIEKVDIYFSAHDAFLQYTCTRFRS